LHVPESPEAGALLSGLNHLEGRYLKSCVREIGAVPLSARTRSPARRFRASPRPCRGLPDIDYPFHDRAAKVTTCDRICFNRQKIDLGQVFLSQVFAGQSVGIKQADDRIWLVSFRK
jgi:hypothetical protein